MGRRIYTHIYRGDEMKTEIPLKPCKFIVSVEFEAHEKLSDEEVKQVLFDKLSTKTRVFKEVEVLWRVE